MRRPSAQPQPPLQGARLSPAPFQSPPKADQARWPKSTRKQWGTRWVQGAVTRCCFSVAQLEPRVFFCQPPRWGPQVTRGWSAHSENVELCPFMPPYFSSHIIDLWLQKLCPKSFFLHFNSSSAYLPSQTTAAFVLVSGCFLSRVVQLLQPRNPAPSFLMSCAPGVGGRHGKHGTQALCPNKGSALGRRLSASQFVCQRRQEAGPDTGPQASVSSRVPKLTPAWLYSQILPLISYPFLKSSATFFSIVQQNSHCTWLNDLNILKAWLYF